MDALTVSAKHFSVFAGDPQPGSGQVQIPKFAPGPAVDTGSPLPASMAYGLKTLVGLHMDLSCRSLGCNRLIYNFDSTKREIRCYSGYGHRRPPLDNVYRGRQTYIH